MRETRRQTPIMMARTAAGSYLAHARQMMRHAAAVHATVARRQTRHGDAMDIEMAAARSGRRGPGGPCTRRLVPRGGAPHSASASALMLPDEAESTSVCAASRSSLVPSAVSQSEPMPAAAGGSPGSAAAGCPDTCRAGEANCPFDAALSMLMPKWGVPCAACAFAASACATKWTAICSAALCRTMAPTGAPPRPAEKAPPPKAPPPARSGSIVPGGSPPLGK
mmetsp:Transcript_44172/g.140007  ORF Transcript_44172/g.140007 Transcript_44172/m.140007 type:complete len:223 (+) Transcript_44172:190-858(+)